MGSPPNDHPPIYLFSEPSAFGNTFFDYITPVKFEINTKIDSCDKVFSLSLEDYKAMLCASFISTTGRDLMRNNNNLKYQDDSK